MMSLTVERSILRHCRKCWQLRHHLAWTGSRSISASERVRKPPSHYVTLGVPQEASQSEIKAAFVARSKEIHPDRNPKDPANHERFVQLSEAYTVLSKPSSRREYDFSLAAQLQYDQSLRRAAYGNHYPGASAAPGSSSTGAYDGEQAQPFMDETIWSMRDQTKHGYGGTHDYYGIRGVRKVSNMAIVGGCVFFMGVGMILHFLAFSYSKNYSQKVLDEKNRINHAILKESRERARINGNAKQLEILKARVQAMKESQAKNS